jgi:hypothetical protein
MTRQPRFNAVYLVLAVVGVVLLHGPWIPSLGIAPIPYSEVRPALAAAAS